MVRTDFSRRGVPWVALHALHHLTAAAAVPAGVIVHVLDSHRRQPGGASG